MSRKFDSSGDVWELNELLEILKTEIEARERSGFTSAGEKIPLELEYNPGNLTVAALMTRDNLKFPDAVNPKQGSGNNGDQFGGSRVGKVTCAYCKGKHPAESLSQ